MIGGRAVSAATMHDSLPLFAVALPLTSILVALSESCRKNVTMDTTFFLRGYLLSLEILCYTVGPNFPFDPTVTDGKLI